MGHSCGATLGFQALLLGCEDINPNANENKREREKGKGNERVNDDDDDDLLEAPKAVVGVEGIYDLVLFCCSG